MSDDTPKNKCKDCLNEYLPYYEFPCVLCSFNKEAGRNIIERFEAKAYQKAKGKE